MNELGASTLLCLALAACGGGLVTRGPATPSAMCECDGGMPHATGSEFPVSTLWWGSCTRDGGPLSFTGKEETVPCNDVPHTFKLRCNGVPCTIKKDRVVTLAAGQLTIDVELIPNDGGPHAVQTLGPYTITTPLDAKATCFADEGVAGDAKVRVELGDHGLVPLFVFGMQPRASMVGGAPCKHVRSDRGGIIFLCRTRPGSQQLAIQTIDAALTALVECP